MTECLTVPDWRSPITVPGLYEGIGMDRYHGPVEICPGPSISSSGLRTIESKSPFHYWYDSPLNPNPPEREEKAHFIMGRLLHELLERGDATWADWHVTPPGFSEAHVKKWEQAIAERDSAKAAGKSCVPHGDAMKATQMVAAVHKHPRAKLLFKSGIFEPTLAWQDKETGIWLRVRPDFFPSVRKWIPDYKSTVSAKPDDFAKSVDNYGYHMAAALYLDGIEALFGERPAGFMFVAQEKTEPFVTEIFQLDEEAIGWGRVLNRRSLRRLAKCLATDTWPTYGNDVNLVTLPDWTRKRLELRTQTYELDVPTFGN